MKRKYSKFIAFVLFVWGFALAQTGSAYAFTAPANGDMWYEFYNIFYEKMLQGPVGATLAGGTLGWGLMSAIRGSIPMFAISTCTAGVLFNLDSVVNGFGLCI